MNRMNYYNEFDPKAAAWLWELIKCGVIPDGEVDDRDIHDVESQDLTGFTQHHFFAGIGGWSYALRLAGWPDDRPVWTASLPCQPFSKAGKQKGIKDDRHLWSTFFKLVKECNPPTIFGEQVQQAIRLGWLDGVFDALEAENYACGTLVLPACSVGAPHIRQRIWWVAESPSVRQCGLPVGEAEEEGGMRGLAGSSQVDWSRSIWWPCQDGKWRRVPGRMGDSESQQTYSSDERQQQFSNGCSDGGMAYTRHSHGCTEQGEQLQKCDPRIGEPGHSDNRSDEYAPSRHERLEIESEIQLMVDGISSESMAQSMGAFLWQIDWETFPLASPEIGRPGALKGSGNAIVPQVAAEFIKSFMETEQMRGRHVLA